MTPSKMKAVFFRRHGAANVLQYGDLPVPKIQPTEALIQVEACALNHLDLWIRQGLPGVKVPMPHIAGSEIVGRVVKKGSRVSGVRVGDRVLVAPGLSCGRCGPCEAGQESRCPKFQILGLQRNGGYAQYTAVPARNLIRVNDRWKPHEWAAVPLVFLTAWHMLITRAGLQRGETVLIHGAGSGIGSAAIQIARWAGAKVFSTAGSEKKVQRARALGAHQAWNYRRADFAKEVLRATRGGGVNVVFEHIGLATWAGSVRCLARGGRLVTCGATTGPKVELDLRFFYTKELSVLGCYMGSRRELARVLKLIGQGILRPVVAATYPLGEAARAQERMEGRDFFGKLVLKP